MNLYVCSPEAQRLVDLTLSLALSFNHQCDATVAREASGAKDCLLITAEQQRRHMIVAALLLPNT